ncbi:MAG: hypothetical protein KatS3mg110_3230 [Pirellulaceae bacterium]|nr:MAG: hypothetical protein KatS3mg110_3230 [Pirellulaceae bacterium]
MNSSRTRVAEIFNAMRRDYDQISDLWYAWLFCRLHWLIVDRVIRLWRDPTQQRVLDIGCGTGFQTFLYASVGAKVVGIDVAEALVQEAWDKAVNGRHIDGQNLFPAHFRFVEHYNKRIGTRLARWFPNRQFVMPSFQLASADRLPYMDESFSHVNCCGSVLSFVDKYTTAFDEIRRVLRPGGTFILEVESKYNFDLIWPVLDATVLRGKLGYDTGLREALVLWKSGLGQHVWMEYPFGNIERPIHMNIRLFSRLGLKKELCSRGLCPSRWWTIHSITNLIPSTLLDSPRPSKFLVRLFSWLARLEETLPFSLPGCSLVVFGAKRDRQVIA